MHGFCESFYSKSNSILYTSHPNIHQFLNILNQCQTDTHIKITSSHKCISVKRRAKYTKIQEFVDEQINNLKNKIISPLQYLKTILLKNPFFFK